MTSEQCDIENFAVEYGN